MEINYISLFVILVLFTLSQCTVSCSFSLCLPDEFWSVRPAFISLFPSLKVASNSLACLL